MGRPSQLQRVCVGQSLFQQQQGQLNISWDSLPCCLQNGADITSYIIQYTRLETGTPRNISSSDSRLGIHCRQVAGGPYSCLADESLFLTGSGETYSFQVAARNHFGTGSFSNPVNFMFGSPAPGKRN